MAAGEVAITKHKAARVKPALHPLGGALRMETDLALEDNRKCIQFSATLWWRGEGVL